MVQIQQYFRETLLGSPTMQMEAIGYTKRLIYVYPNNQHHILKEQKSSVSTVTTSNPSITVQVVVQVQHGKRLATYIWSELKQGGSYHAE